MLGTQQLGCKTIIINFVDLAQFLAAKGFYLNKSKILTRIAQSCLAGHHQISSCGLHYEYVSNAIPLGFFVSGQISNTESELKKLAEENPDLQDAYIAKQKRLKVRKLFVFPLFIMSLSVSDFFCHNANI